MVCLTAIKDDGFRKQCDSSYNYEKKKMFASDLRPNWATNKFPYVDLQEKRGLQLYKMLSPLFLKNLFLNTPLIVMHISFFNLEESTVAKYLLELIPGITSSALNKNKQNSLGPNNHKITSDVKRI